MWTRSSILDCAYIQYLLIFNNLIMSFFSYSKNTNDDESINNKSCTKYQEGKMNLNDQKWEKNVAIIINERKNNSFWVWGWTNRWNDDVHMCKSN